MPATRPPPGFEEIQRTASARIFGNVVGYRLLVAPLVVAFILTIAWLQPGRWRLVLLSCGGTLMLVVSAYEVVRFRRRGLSPSSIPFNMALAVFGQLIVSFATGGIESPLIVPAVPIALLNGLFVRPAGVRKAHTAVQIVAFWAMAAVEVFGLIPNLTLTWFGGGARAGHNDALLWTTAFAMSAVVVIATGAGRALRSTFDGMILRGLKTSEDALQAQADSTRELTALSGEIAHELKNPMASVKGLAALLAQSTPEGKPAERLAVLRREVDRMQGILDEFLNFSRPLVPLSLEAVELGALCDEVAALHEGMARERGVSIVVEAEPVSVRCDPRKMKQVLINLVQNAIEASLPRGAVELEVQARAGGGAAVRVLDRGPGVDPAVGERAFEPGVTTKARGSGLGLTIARALARQHGGELSLSTREGGGCAAQIALPASPAEEKKEASA